MYIFYPCCILTIFFQIFTIFLDNKPYLATGTYLPVHPEALLLLRLEVEIEGPETGGESSEGEILSHQLVQELVLAHSSTSANLMIYRYGTGYTIGRFLGNLFPIRVNMNKTAQILGFMITEI